MHTPDLMKNKGRFSKILGAAGIGLATADLHGGVLSSNPSFQKMIGYSTQELSKLHIKDFTHPGDAALDAQQFADLVEGKIEQYSSDKRYQTKNGELVWVHVVVSMLHQSASEAYVVLLIENITDRKRGEEHEHRLIAERAARNEAEANLEFLNSVLQNMPAGVAIVEAPSGNILLTNRRLNELSEIVGTRLTPEMDSDAQPSLIGIMQSDALNHVIGKAEVQEPREMSFLRGDTKTILRMAVAPVLNREGKVIAAISTAYDITASKYAEEALRTSEKLASVGRLAATIAHEINNPLESVTNLLYLLDSAPDMDQVAKQMIVLAQEELSRVVHIVRQTLGFYRESSTPVKVMLNHVVDDVLGLYSRKIEDSKVAVAKQAEGEGSVEAFPGEMRQVISNLVTNALDALNKRSGAKLTIRISDTKDWHPHTYRRTGVKVVISDNAGGIEPENLKRIFDPFFSTKGEKGTGLGLWVSHGIVQKHGGRIRVRSSKRADRSGTTFTIFIPKRGLAQPERHSDAA